MTNAGGHRWRPIEDLPEGWERLGDRDLPAMAAEWAEGAERYADAAEIREFRRQLIREIAIETGVIEGLYSIDRGVTETLIRVGLIKEELEQGVLDRPAGEILPLLQDHESATEGLFDFVKQNRPLSAAYIKELHAHLTRHQPETDAVTPDGRRVRVELLRGAWKQQPNNPHRPDGAVHEYCPPEQVGSQMDELLRMYARHEAMGAPPDVEAAWLHHRFTQIHPFQDGNGRVARALASLVLLRAKWSLMNVTRNDSGYIAALERADAGDIEPFVRLLADTQRRWFERALTVLSNIEAAHTTDPLALVRDRLSRRSGVSGKLRASLGSRVGQIIASKLQDVTDSLADLDSIEFETVLPNPLASELPRDVCIMLRIRAEPYGVIGFAWAKDKRGEINGLVPFIASRDPQEKDFLHQSPDSISLKRFWRRATLTGKGESSEMLLDRFKENLPETLAFLFLEWERRR